MKKQTFLKIDKRVSLLNETEAFIYMILVYAKFRKIQISRGYIQTAFGGLTVNHITKILRKIEEIGLIKRENRYTNAYNGGDIRTIFDFTLTYDKWFMIKLNFVQDIVDPKLKGFALRLRELAFDDSLVIKYNKKDLSEKMGVSSNTLRKYLKKLEELGIVSDLKLNSDFFVVRENTPTVYLSDDRMEEAKEIVANTAASETKLYKQMSYFMEKQMYLLPNANELFLDILGGFFGKTKIKKEETGRFLMS